MANIYLVGFMGTGKSAVGKELAKRFKRQFLDLDELIEAREKRQISEIFAKEGEAYFRKIEKEQLGAVSGKDNLVVACGGGIVIDEANINVMKQTGKVICLSASSGVILQRTAGHAHRPLLNVADPKAHIEELLSLRAPFYAKADYSIDTTKFSIQEVVDKMIEYVKR